MTHQCEPPPLPALLGRVGLALGLALGRVELDGPQSDTLGAAHPKPFPTRLED